MVLPFYYATSRADKQLWACGQGWLGLSNICKVLEFVFRTSSPSQHLLCSRAPFQKGSPHVHEKYPGEKKGILPEYILNIIHRC